MQDEEYESEEDEEDEDEDEDKEEDEDEDKEDKVDEKGEDQDVFEGVMDNDDDGVSQSGLTDTMDNTTGLSDGDFEDGKYYIQFSKFLLVLMYFLC